MKKQAKLFGFPEKKKDSRHTSKSSRSLPDPPGPRYKRGRGGSFPSGRHANHRITNSYLDRQYPVDYGLLRGVAGRRTLRVRLARLYGAKVFLTHVVSPDPHLSVPLDRLPHEADPVWQEAWRNTADFLQHTPLEKVTHEEILERGELWDVISSIIADHEIDLLVLGTRGRQGLRKLVLGSEAEKIYRQAPCPVITVGPNAGISGRPHKPRQILFPTDISESSLRALPYALSLAEETEATLTLLHFVPLVPWQEQGPVAESAQRPLEALVPEEAKLWCEPK